MSAETTVFLGTGRRKTSTARIRLVAGSGKLTANDRDFDSYFKHDNFARRAASPLATADVKEKFATFGYENYFPTPEEFKQFMANESKRFGTVIRQAGLSLD